MRRRARGRLRALAELGSLAVCLLLHARADGVERFSTGSFVWDDVSSGAWSGPGVPGGGDTFRIQPGHEVGLADVTLTTGRVIVEGGSLAGPCGATLRLGAALELTAGALRLGGSCALARARVRDYRVVSTAAGGRFEIRLPLPAPLPDVRAGDWIVVWSWSCPRPAAWG